MGWSPGIGSPFSGPGATQTSAAAGLPFAGIPSELAAKAERILAEEPTHPEPVIHFSQIPSDRRPFTLRRFLGPHRWGLLAAFGLVVLEAAALQAGPWLTKVGIDQGVGKGDVGVLTTVTVLYLAAVVVNVAAGAIRVGYTGRLGEKLSYELRLRVFSHLQRLGLDYYTAERQGRLLTRMTSDIDALSVLFQDGLVNLAVQGLTLVLVGGILLSLDLRLARSDGAVPGAGVAEALQRVRARISHLDRDREPGPDLAAAASMVHTGELVDLAG